MNQSYVTIMIIVFISVSQTDLSYSLSSLASSVRRTWNTDNINVRALLLLLHSLSIEGAVSNMQRKGDSDEAAAAMSPRQSGAAAVVVHHDHVRFVDLPLQRQILGCNIRDNSLEKFWHDCFGYYFRLLEEVGHVFLMNKII